MDDLAGFFAGPRARNAFTLKLRMAPPWAIDVRDESPLTALVVTWGRCRLQVPGRPDATLAPGDVALVRGPDPYVVSDERGSRPRITILPGQHCVGPDGEHLAGALDLGVGTWGTGRAHADDPGATTMLVAAYTSGGEVGRRLVEALPPLVVLTATEWSSPLVDLLGRELTAVRPGRAAALDRLVDLLVIEVIRIWATGSVTAPGWFDGGGDPEVRQALHLVHDDLAAAWTVESLARRVGLSRAAFARRFAEKVGQGPIGYLTARRMSVAADLLQDPDATVGSVARQVGYPSPFTFSSAFKRHYGRSPRHFAQATA
ncbi:MAG TPA: AraC family transcriptional regulator [Microlunatus sp.]|nr:AraC family transcriptional regulator [Microlunatus sp.]